MKRPRLRLSGLRREPTDPAEPAGLAGPEDAGAPEAAGSEDEAPAKPVEDEVPADEADGSAGGDPRPRKHTADDLWFRASTRVRAGGYWLRERAQWVRAAARSGARWAAERWAGLSRGARIRAGAVAGVLLLYLVIKLVPVPGVPCGVSAVKECPPGDDAVAFVPADALLYAHVTLEADSAQAERARDAFDELGELERLVVGSAAAAVPAPSGAQVDLRADVLEWAEEDLAIASVPQPKDAAATAVIAGVSDGAGAEEFLTKVAPPAAPAVSEQGDATLLAYPDGFAAAFSGEELVFGDEPAVRRALEAEAGAAESLEGSDAAAAREELPEARFAEVYLSSAGVQRLLAGRAGPAAQLETFVDYGATSGLAAAAVACEDGIEVDMVSTLDPDLAAKSPSFFSELPRFEPDLAGEIGERAIGYVGVGQVGPSLTELLARGGGEAGGLGRALGELASRLEREAGVNPLRDLLPALGGQAALVAEPTDGVPFASLVVEGVDEGAATEALARLQGPLLRSVGVRGKQVPRFEESEVDGVKVSSVQLGPTVNLSYAAFDGMLVVSTSPAGIEQVRSGGESLADASAYEAATDGLPDAVSALVFLNLDELFAQVTRTGLVEDPSFADLTVLFDNAASIGLAVQGEDESIRTELFLTVD
ncbi:MAG: DUF3352 domain-containing protein [Solirubrobacterales bacterium]